MKTLLIKLYLGFRSIPGLFVSLQLQTVIFLRRMRKSPKNDTLIIVSSHVNYFDKTFPHLINSMKKHGVSLSKVVFFVGGSDIKKFRIEQDVRIYDVPYNAFDLNALIGIVENRIESEYYFLLHDTVEISSRNFIDIVDYYPFKPFFTYSILPFPSKNMGVYSIDAIKHLTPFILKYKEQYLSALNIQEQKRLAVEQEDMLFQTNTKHSILFPSVSKTVLLKKNTYRQKAKAELINKTGIIKYTVNHKRSESYATIF